MTIATGYDHEDGQVIAASASKLLAFHGGTPCDQAAAQTCVSTSAVITACGVGGFSVAQASAAIVAINSVISALKEKGLMAT